jgi:uncharacterized Tic20 family protein
MSDTNPYETPPPATPLEDLDFTPSHDDRNLALIAHLSGLAGVLGAGMIGFLGPLIIYLLKKDTSPYVEAQAKEALNFQITLLLISIPCFFLVAISCGTLFPLIFLPMTLQVIFGIIAALAVRDGSHYRYPFNFRLLQ